MNKKLIKVALTITLAVGVIGLTGCGMLDNALARLKGQLVGTEFNVGIYDNFANQTIDISGTKITVEGLKDEAGTETSYIDITINGKDLKTVGNTVIFAEKGLDKVTDFKMPKTVDQKGGSTGYMPADRLINDVKNNIGNEKTIVIESQQGVPLAVYQGKKVNITIPDDLPKMTLVSIDGKALYIHRANCVILDTELIK